MGKLRGMMTAIVTPFDQSGQLNLEALPGFLDFQRAAGIEGVVVAGSNGEGVSMPVEMRKRLLEAVMQHRGNLTVIAGTGAANMEDAIELTRHAGQVGADAALILPPFFFKNVSPRGVANYFRRVLDASEIPVLLYHIPQVSAVEVSEEVLDLLEGHPRLAGVKDSSGHWERTYALITQRRHLAIFSGSDDLMSRALAAGAAGAISGGANAFPELIVAIKRALEGGGDVAAAQARLDTVKEIVLSYPLFAGNKSILAHRGVARMWVRPPLVDLSPEQEAELITRLQAAGFLPSFTPRALASPS
jgi:4-hydroxy-tetrahydrodipicolinate synthase